MGHIRSAKSRKFLGPIPTSDEFCHKMVHTLLFIYFLYVVTICIASPELLANLGIAEFCEETQKQFFAKTKDNFSEKVDDRRSPNFPAN